MIKGFVIKRDIAFATLTLAICLIMASQVTIDDSSVNLSQEHSYEANSTEAPEREFSFQLSVDNVIENITPRKARELRGSGGSGGSGGRGRSRSRSRSSGGGDKPPNYYSGGLRRTYYYNGIQINYKKGEDCKPNDMDC